MSLHDRKEEERKKQKAIRRKEQNDSKTSKVET